MFATVLGLGVGVRSGALQPSQVNPLLVALGATVALAAVLEWHRRRATDHCPYAEQGLAVRSTLYLTAFLTFAALTATAEFGGLGTAMMFGVVAVAIGIGLALHVIVDHSPSEFGAAPIWLLILNWATVILIVASPVIIFVVASRR